MKVTSILEGFPGTMIFKMLDAISFPALLMRVEGSRITVESVNQRFQILAGSKSFDIKAGSLRKFYPAEEVFSRIVKGILEAVSAQSKFAENISLENHLLGGTTLIYHVENTVLYTQQDVSYVLHTLTPLKLEVEEKKMADQILLQSEKRFRALVHDGSDMIAILDDMANYLYVSPSSKSVLDFDPQIFIGRNAFEFIHPSDLQKTKAEFATASGQRKVALSPFRFLHNDGSWRWVQTMITDLRESPAVKGFVANSRDVTDIFEAQRAIEISNERYRYVGKATSDAVWDWDIPTGSIFWGEGFLKIFGYADHMLSSDIQTRNSIIHESDAERVMGRMEIFLSSQNTNWRDDYRLRKADGTYAHVVDKGFVIRDEAGHPLRMIGALQDITLRKKEEARLRILESVVTHTVDAVLVAEIWPSGDLMTRIIFVNDAFEKMTGYSTQEVEGRSPWFLQGAGSDQSELSRLLDSLNNNKPYRGTIINYKKNGEPIWVSYSITPVADQLGNYTHWIAILREVSEQKRHEYEQLLLSEVTGIFNSGKGLQETTEGVLKKIANFGDFGFAALWTADPITEKLDLTSQYFTCQDTKDSAGWALSLDSGRQYALQIRNNMQEGYWDMAVDQNQPGSKNGIRSLFGFPLRHHQTLIGVLLVGSIKQAHLKLNGLPKALGKHLGTELHRKYLKTALEESEKRYSELFHLSPLPMWVYNFETLDFLDVNQTALSHYGYSREEFLFMNIRDIRPTEDLGLLETTLKETRKQENTIFQGTFKHVKKDGSIIQVDIKSNTIIFKGTKAKVIIATDITERLEYFHAIEKRNDQLREIAWIQSHKVRAPLARLMGLVNLVSGDIKNNLDVKKILGYIDSAADELDKVIREVVLKSEELDNNK